MTSHYSIGWDVGAWYCEKNAKSRDAIFVLDPEGKDLGRPFRGGLRRCFNEAENPGQLIDALFALCGVEPDRSAHVTLAIDTPLGFPTELLALADRGDPIRTVGERQSNPYLFRATERHLFGLGWTPMSAVEQMIGSQATKGIHLRARFAPHPASTGVWTDGDRLTVIETYPAPCRSSSQIKTLIEGRVDLKNDDLRDARVCAVVAHLFRTDPQTLLPPPPETPEGEGWIWVPCDAVPVK
ncbi:MAG: hypothetical protein KDN18_19190 [Verrucomicrobiae bacterium]|nr:hypothetical protein [Verrucomicrobiae bacterium]